MPAASRKKRLLVLDDHPMTRYGLVQLINSEPDLFVGTEVGDARQALAALTPPLPDLILADLSMPGKSGIEFIKDMGALHPEVPILVVSMYDETVYAERALRAGARGYLMKTEGGQKLLEAIRWVLSGKLYIGATMTETILGTLTNRSTGKLAGGMDLLTDREFEVFHLLGEGLTTRQISQRLCLSIATIGTHRMHIKRKLKIETGAQLTQTATRWVAAEKNS